MANEQIRKATEFGFTAVPTDFLYCPVKHPAAVLSLAAKGLYVYLLSKPDGWTFHVREILTHTSTGRDAILTARAALVSSGFLELIEVRNEKGQVSHTDWVILYPWPPSPYTEKPYTENRSLSKKDLSKTDKKGTPKPPDASNAERPPEIDCLFDLFWKAYPRKTSKPQALKVWKRLFGTLSTAGDRFDLIMAIREGLKQWKACDSWKEQGGKFIPYPATWLNGERWKDDPGPVTAPVGEVRPEDQHDFKV